MNTIEIYQYRAKKWSLPDFKIDAIGLGPHLGIQDEVAALDTAFAKQMLLQEKSSIPSGRVPLYICPCGDLACGVLSVFIEELDDCFKWSKFGREATWGDGSEDDALFQSEYMKRTGPFHFEKAEYKSALGMF